MVLKYWVGVQSAIVMSYGGSGSLALAGKLLSYGALIRILVDINHKI